jgi:hypothetical protein
MWALAFLVSFLLHHTAHSAPADAVPAAASPIPEDYRCLHHRLPYPKNEKLFIFLSACGPEKEFDKAVLEGIIKGGVRQVAPVPVSEGNATDVSTPPPGAVGAELVPTYEGCLCHHDDLKENPGLWELKCSCAPEGAFDRALLGGKLHAGENNATNKNILGEFGAICERIADDKDSKFWLLVCIAGTEKDFGESVLKGSLHPGSLQEGHEEFSNHTHVEYACDCELSGDNQLQGLHCGCGDWSKYVG